MTEFKIGDRVQPTRTKIHGVVTGIPLWSSDTVYTVVERLSGNDDRSKLQIKLSDLEKYSYWFEIYGEVLNPCPFCDNSDLRIEHCLEDSYVDCRNCGTCGPDATTRFEAINKWNRGR